MVETKNHKTRSNAKVNLKTGPKFSNYLKEKNMYLKTLVMVSVAGCAMSLLTACGEPKLECSNKDELSETGKAVLEYIKEKDPEEAKHVGSFMKFMLLTGQKSEICGLSASQIQHKSHNIVKDKVDALKQDLKGGIDASAKRTKDMIDSIGQ